MLVAVAQRWPSFVCTRLTKGYKLVKTTVTETMMKDKTCQWDDLRAEAHWRIFTTAGGVAEYHAFVQLTDCLLDSAHQFRQVEEATQRLAKSLLATVVWKRYFLSDAVNQQAFLPSEQPGAVSVVQQPPLNQTKVAVWLYLVQQPVLHTSGHETVWQHSAYTHYYHTQQHALAGDEEQQTAALFDDYIQKLHQHGCTLKQNCHRTWIYVQGVDLHYRGMVEARKACFEREGLTQATHYLSSTGIEGKYKHPEVRVLMDAYAVDGLQQEQIQYLEAPDLLNPTHEYGVTFERGTALTYGDRKHLFISGTASINNRGEVVHPHDVLKQADRLFENIAGLLANGGATLGDVAHWMVYLRDTADYARVAHYMRTNYAQIPTLLVWAPVCRPGWLIEAECMAIKEVCRPEFADF